MFNDSESRAPTPSLRKEPKPVCVEQASPGVEVGPKLSLDEYVELLTRDTYLSALSAALKIELGLTDVKKPPPTPSPEVELVTGEVKSCRGIHSSAMDTCASPFHPAVTTVPVCNVGGTSEAEMKSYGLAAFGSLAITHASTAADATGGTGGCSRGTKTNAIANVQLKLPEFDQKKTCPNSPMSSLNSYISPATNTLM